MRKAVLGICLLTFLSSCGDRKVKMDPFVAVTSMIDSVATKTKEERPAEPPAAGTLKRQRAYRGTRHTLSRIGRRLFSEHLHKKRCPIRIRTKGCPALPWRKEPGSCLPKKRRRDRYTSPFLRIRREEPMTGLATTNRPKYWSGCEPSPRSVAKRPFPRNLRPTP